MIFIQRPQTDPFFNIAAEEYILKRDDKDVVMLWQCSPSVIIGKHQNTLTEVNTGFADRLNIPVIRRLSGGGTVYHDEGNINYTVITTEKRRDRLIDFRKFTQPVIDLLGTMGLKVLFEGKNNLVIKGKKFSGNSAHVYKNRVMHHGTLLFNSDLDILDKAIRPEMKWKIRDKAVQSIRATVTNIRDHLNEEMDINEFKAMFQMFLLNYHSISEVKELSKIDIQQINKMAGEKYKTWQWNFGYSPEYLFRNKIKGIGVEMKVKNGKIIDVGFEGDFEKREKLASLLTGLPYKKEDINRIMDSLNMGNETKGLMVHLIYPGI